MNSNTQVFFNFTTTFRTFLRSPPSVNFTKELSSLPTHLLDDGSKLTKCSVKHMFSKHPFGTGAVIQVFHEDQIASITKGMSLFVVKVRSCVVDLVMKSCNFNALFLVILRPPLLPRKPALQQFQLTLQAFKELWRFYKNTVACCQKLFQTNINPDGMTMRFWVGNTNIALERNRRIPFVSFPQEPHPLDRKPVRDRSMQVKWNCFDLGQFNVQIRYWIVLKLRKQQRFELTVFFESRKAKPS